MDIWWGLPSNSISSDLSAGNKRKRDESNHLIYATGKEIHFSVEINTLTISYLIELIAKIIHKNKDDFSDDSAEKLTITYIIDSGGGSVIAILKFYDFIRLTKKKYPWIEFVSIINGLAASAATVMGIVADKKYITENSSVMIHELATGFSHAKYTHIMSYSDHLTDLHTKLLNIYLRHGCNKDKAQLEILLKNETWMNSEQYVSIGFVDEIK